ncbi:MAG: hydrogenase/urease maturation nickel metallochaperone HypA [archaeon]
MHEIVFAKNIIEQVKDKGKVKEMELEVGELAGISGEELKEIIEKMTGWAVNIREKISRVKCKCSYSGRAKINGKMHDLVLFSCPKCGNLPKVTEGKDIKVLKVKY